MFDLEALRAVNCRPDLVRESLIVRSYDPKRPVRYRLQKLGERARRVWEWGVTVAVVVASVVAVGVQAWAMAHR